jgi:hypothetical protein
MNSGWARAFTAVLAGVWLIGCNGPGVDLADVRGKVTVAGQPMAGITITFTPESGRPATGVTDASGNFTLSTFSSGDGAVPGKHKVAFAKSATGDLTKGPPMTIPDPSAGGKPMPPTGPETPFNSKYTNPDTSGITVDVLAGKTNEVGPWDLEK